MRSLRDEEEFEENLSSDVSSQCERISFGDARILPRQKLLPFESPRYSENESQVEAQNEDDGLDKWPPDFEIAEDHKIMNLAVTHDVEEIQNDPEVSNDKIYCKCCGRIQKKYVSMLPLNCDILDLDFLGIGFPLYYHLKLFTISCFAFISIFAGLPCFIINLNQDGRREWDPNSSYIVSTSIGNFGNEPDSYSKSIIILQICLNIVCIMFIFISSIFMRDYQNWMIREFDEKNITPSDFGIMISNIPKNKKEHQVRQWIKDHFEHDAEIITVNYCYL
ncbi:unnamed protein product [Moneuplotes crassus]|uniref:Uncharacterized protein n=1 Tax=Euplotes crassus TaxID=5936 RepID=A0AAD1UG70_EUPCR|nr:unnamed protein product [Moneuplotes crassus]